MEHCRASSQNCRAAAPFVERVSWKQHPGVLVATATHGLDAGWRASRWGGSDLSVPCGLCLSTPGLVFGKHKECWGWLGGRVESSEGIRWFIPHATPAYRAPNR